MSMKPPSCLIVNFFVPILSISPPNPKLRCITSLAHGAGPVLD